MPDQYLQTTPSLSTELITQLDKQFPHKCPDPTMSDREIWMYAGSRALIDLLLARLKIEDEEDNILNTRV